MNKVAGSKKPIKPIAADGAIESKTISTEKTQNIPKRALGNFIAAATKACLRNLSAARISPSDTTKCKISTILGNPTAVPPPSAPADLGGIRLLDSLTCVTRNRRRADGIAWLPGGGRDERGVRWEEVELREEVFGDLCNKIEGFFGGNLERWQRESGVGASAKEAVAMEGSRRK